VWLHRLLRPTTESKLQPCYQSTEHAQRMLLDARQVMSVPDLQDDGQLRC